METNFTHKITYSICVSGAADGPTVQGAADMARALGDAIARSGHTILTGATVGLPYYAAAAAKLAGGKSIGFSPAVSLREHLRKYRLPYSSYDFINFTGMHYVGRDVYLVQSSDAVITIGGRFGSLHEFTSALEANKPCGVLTGSGGTADLISGLIDMLDPARRSLVIFHDNPKELVKLVVEKINEKYADIHEQLERFDEYWFLRDESRDTREG